MKHTYLSVETINEALACKCITQQEAQGLYVKIDSQAMIFKAISK